jgi:hypothetical protein
MKFRGGLLSLLKSFFCKSPVALPSITDNLIADANTALYESLDRALSFHAVEQRNKAEAAVGRAYQVYVLHAPFVPKATLLKWKEAIDNAQKTLKSPDDLAEQWPVAPLTHGVLRCRELQVVDAQGYCQIKASVSPHGTSFFKVGAGRGNGNVGVVIVANKNEASVEVSGTCVNMNPQGSNDSIRRQAKLMWVGEGDRSDPGEIALSIHDDMFSNKEIVRAGILANGQRVCGKYRCGKKVRA